MRLRRKIRRLAIAMVTLSVLLSPFSYAKRVHKPSISDLRPFYSQTTGKIKYSPYTNPLEPDDFIYSFERKNKSLPKLAKLKKFHTLSNTSNQKTGLKYCCHNKINPPRTAKEIRKLGGDCNDLSNYLVTYAFHVGIPAGMVVIYPEASIGFLKGVSAHVISYTEFEKRRTLVDMQTPYFGLSSGFLSYDDIIAGKSGVFKRALDYHGSKGLYHYEWFLYLDSLNQGAAAAAIALRRAIEFPTPSGALIDGYKRYLLDMEYRIAYKLYTKIKKYKCTNKNMKFYKQSLREMSKFGRYANPSVNAIFNIILSRCHCLRSNFKQAGHLYEKATSELSQGSDLSKGIFQYGVNLLDQKCDLPL